MSEVVSGWIDPYFFVVLPRCIYNCFFIVKLIKSVGMMKLCDISQLYKISMEVWILKAYTFFVYDLIKVFWYLSCKLC